MNAFSPLVAIRVKMTHAPAGTQQRTPVTGVAFAAPPRKLDGECGGLRPPPGDSRDRRARLGDDERLRDDRWWYVSGLVRVSRVCPSSTRIRRKTLNHLLRINCWCVASGGEYAADHIEPGSGAVH